MNKKKISLIFLIITILVSNIVISDEFFGGGGADQDILSQDGVNTKIEAGEDFSGNIPDGETITIKGVEFGPGGQLIYTDGKATGKGTPQGFENPIDMKGATFKNGQIASAEEVTINGQTYKDVTDVKKNADGGYDIKTAAESKPNAKPKSIPTKFTNKNSQNDKYDSNGNLISSEKGQSSTAKDDSGKNIFSAINYEGLEVSEDGIHIGEADSFTYDSSTSTFAKNIFIPFDGTFKLAYADQVIIGNKIFNKIKESKFELDAGKLKKAHITSAKDNNLFKLPSDIRFTGDYMTIKANKSASFDLEYIQEPYTNGVQRQGISIRQDKGVKLSLQNNNKDWLTFNTIDDQGTLKILENQHPYFEFKKGNIAYLNPEFNETIETYGTSAAEIDMQLGTGYIILAPISSPGGKYTYNDIIYPESSFAVYNPSNEAYELGFRKSEDFFSRAKFNTIKQGNGHGYVDFVTKAVEFNGIIEYQRYGQEKYGDRLSQLILRPMYISQNNNNQAQLSLSLNKIDINNFQITNQNPSLQTNSIIYQGHHIITEKGNKRYLSIDTENTVTNLINNYQVSYIPYNVEYIQNTMKQNNIIAYNTESQQQNEFEKSILIFPAFNAYKQGAALFDIAKW